MSDLVKRLRGIHWCVTTDERGCGRSENNIASEAADEITRLRAERDEALNQLDSARHSGDVLEKRNAQLLVKLAKADALLRITKGALGDIADGEPEWPSDPARELEWCRNRALAAYREGSDT